MKANTSNQNTQWSRRIFLKSTGLFLSGLSFLKPSIFAAGKSGGRKDVTLLPNMNADPLTQHDAILPDGVKRVWDISKAWHDTTPTRERICINGLWQWQPGTYQSDLVPVSEWGYFKVPGNWPGINNYMQKGSQMVYPHPDWKDKTIDKLNVAWYQREISIPENWNKRRVLLSLVYLNSSALVYINNKLAGEILFPSGELDLTSICLPGGKYTISIKVTALPLKDVVAIYNDSNAPRQGKGNVDRSGLCGDVYLVSTPLKTRISDVRVITSVRREEITFIIALENLMKGSKYNIHTVISERGEKIAEFTSKEFRMDDLSAGYISLTEQWKPEKMWDIHTPGNRYDLSASLLENNKILIDTALTTSFGFREFWIEGRDFYLNGTRIFLSAVPFDNGQIGAALANYEGARESIRRLKSFGINFVYTHNYGCEPGTHISFEEILKAADDEGMLISLSQPHFGQYDWTASDADEKNGYARHAKFYTHVAQNHPSVVFYSMSHNATGYTDDMNPDLIDGLNRTDSQWSQNNVRKALRAEAIVSGLDSGRIVYHHSSGNLSSMHTSNFYPNWVPIQEMNDWFGHWATAGVKPLMLCEFGAPFTWDWAIYRGWYKGKREFGSARVPWEFCLAEWNSQFVGDQAYKISEYEKENLRWEAERFRQGEVWGRSDYPNNFDSRIFEERNPVFALHLVSNWRAFRTWGISINSPWHHSPYWKLKDGVRDEQKNFKIDWENLQKPGLSPDFVVQRANRMDLDIANDRSDWIPNAAGDALTRNNMSLLAYIGGKPSAFTSQDHNYLPGSSFEKQLIVINNSRKSVRCECKWSLNLNESLSGTKTLSLQTGQQERIPLTFDLPSTLPSGVYDLKTSVRFGNYEIQDDSFAIHILPSIATAKSSAVTALFDPKGDTQKLLDGMDILYQPINAGADLSGFDVLIVGREALTADNPGLDLSRVRNGLKVIVFEQSSEVLEKRFGFRVQEYGLRQVYNRLSDHPVLNGIGLENLRNWHGDATLLSPRLTYEVNSDLFNGVQTVRWCDIPVTRLWRCGNRGNVASVLIEKPSCGNFMPVIDGGYSLQYSPLMEYREGKGMVMFCQMDVTGRTEADPAAERLTRNLISYVSEWKPGKNRKAVFAGDSEGKRYLEKAGVSLVQYENKKLAVDQVLIVAPGGSRQLLSGAKAIHKWIKEGGHILAVGLDQTEIDNLLNAGIKLKTEEHIAAYFETFGVDSPFAGIGPADVHNRAPKNIPLVSSGATITGNGVLASTDNDNVIFCQLVPWQLDFSNEQHNVKQTYRRTSFLLNRILSNMGVANQIPLLERFNNPLVAGKEEQRWLDGLYLDVPEEWDDPYRFFRW